MKRRDLLNHLRLGKTQLRIVGPRCRVIGRFLITQQDGSVGSWIFPYPESAYNSVSQPLFSNQWVQG